MERLSQYAQDAAGDETASAHRSMSELQADLFWRPNLTKACTVADAHKACLELLERQLAVVLECAKEGDAGVRFLLYTIAEKLDDQMVRFEIWSSDVNAKTGTLGEEPFPGAFSDDTNRLFELVKERLLKILELAGLVSDDLSTVFGVLGSFDNTSSRNITSQELQEPCDHASSIISEIDPVLQNLNVMVRPVRNAQAALRKEGSYWEHRQKFLQVKNAGRSSTPSDFPSPSPSGDSDESFSSAGYPDRTMRLGSLSESSTGYPDRTMRLGSLSESSDKGKKSEVASRSIASLRDSLPQSIVTSPATGRSKGTWPGKFPPRKGRLSVACPSDFLKASIEMLVEHHFQDDDWWQTLDERISVILDEDSLKAMFTCSCTKCRLARRLTISSMKNGGGLQLDRIEDSLRLLAMCILAEKPFLISVLLSVEVDDRVFEEFSSETQVVDETGIAIGDARVLLRFKGLFFGVGILRYLRSSRKEDMPQDGERTWILNEMLELTRMLSSPSDGQEDIQEKSIGQLTFTTTRRMAADRLNEDFPELWTDQVSPQSIGFLVMDMIWFLVGGSALAFAKLESEPELAQAFEVAYILIQPCGRFGIEGSPGEKYTYADLHLRKLWSNEFLESPTRAGGSKHKRSLDVCSISTRSSTMDTADTANYVEIEGDVFKWIIARYRKDRDGEMESACRVRIFKSRNGERVRFVVYDIAKDPNRNTFFQALTANLTFVPVYSFENSPSEFSVKLQPKCGTTKDLSIPYIFTFQSRDRQRATGTRIIDWSKYPGRVRRAFYLDVVQTLMSSSALLNSFSVVMKKHHGFEIRGFEIGFWNSKREQIQASDFGAMQIWKVLDQHELVSPEQPPSDSDTQLRQDSIHQREEQQKRGVKNHPLRFEIALTSQNMLLVIGVRSLLRVRDVDNMGLSITSRDDARASTLIGRLYQAQKVDGETSLPGVPIFQKPPFESPQDGEMILCSALRLGFGSKFARDNARNMLVNNYKAKYF
ncbi:hypothetical protein QTJ16_007144 [Diplocarpon rosae]|uniref:Uncharacterized protein n=1 Tax=Diplocarpon rosae TaxID=946125 RepID=A0AAD9STT1_9HELO|nr:hypothetical protein QTJ16_007144 [Diplocarpon rosae]